mmetsp:Transcript_2312/g.4836  ORF Transcript_2312/g.4836 Transcript_2312/m.4836 type:complete len:369 (-) Transcript_2312:326-1432(-)|eukprot:CAMPEP_0178439522 /NCGR_PEP_ID=MMETSP0689_2-20121128/36204_1 /TAXON_ID=160604 /ORGANISM="Amphidinium massartii, Strain CS-259" /LENGTH=368 /DNA_ID=CAMNT_0020062063 /DNA_START=99 /DNA_END=1205 /DNA_ORIENTATION=+
MAVCGDKQLAGFAFTALVVQNLMLAVVSRFARLSQKEGEEWIGTSVVCCSELTKLIASALLMQVEEKPPIKAGQESAMGLRSWGLMAVPGLLYCAQNNLYFVGVSNLSVSLFQVLNQTKILTTAFFSVTILHKSLRVDQWVALLVLTVGVMMIVGNGDSTTKGNIVIGLIALGSMSCTSGLAGVFLEMMLKNYSATLWERNFQMAVYGLFFGIIAVIVNDHSKVAERGFFSGFNAAVFGVISLQAGGGLVVAMVLKYADNIVKCFAVAISVVLGCVMSRQLYNEGPQLTDPNLWGGTVCVVGATMVYSLGVKGLLGLVGKTAEEPPKPAAKEGTERYDPDKTDESELAPMVVGHGVDGDDKNGNDDKV